MCCICNLPLKRIHMVRVKRIKQHRSFCASACYKMYAFSSAFGVQYAFGQYPPPSPIICVRMGQQRTADSSSLRLCIDAHLIDGGGGRLDGWLANSIARTRGETILLAACRLVHWAHAYAISGRFLLDKCVLCAQCALWCVYGLFVAVFGWFCKCKWVRAFFYVFHYWATVQH